MSICLLARLCGSGNEQLLDTGVKAILLASRAMPAGSNLRNGLIVTKLLFNYLCGTRVPNVAVCDHQSILSLGDGNSGPRNREGVHVEEKTSNTQRATGC